LARGAFSGKAKEDGERSPGIVGSQNCTAERISATSSKNRELREKQKSKVEH